LTLWSPAIELRHATTSNVSNLYLLKRVPHIRTYKCAYNCTLNSFQLSGSDSQLFRPSRDCVTLYTCISGGGQTVQKQTGHLYINECVCVCVCVCVLARLDDTSGYYSLINHVVRLCENVFVRVWVRMCTCRDMFCGKSK